MGERAGALPAAVAGTNGMSKVEEIHGPLRRGPRQVRPALGLLEWFRPGEFERVEAVLEDLRALGISRLRTGVSWADWHTDEGQGWYEWLMRRLAREVELLPCFAATPPSLGIQPKTSSPPRQPRSYADFLDGFVTRFGEHFEHVELWNEPNNLLDWDWRLDPGWQIFAEMVGGAAWSMRQRGKRTVLAGMCPTDVNWLRLIGERGVLAHVDVVGLHGFPGTWEHDWTDWSEQTAPVREVMARYCPEAELWITGTGYSTWRHDEREQLNAFLRALEADAERVYWYAARDLTPELPSQQGRHVDERRCHFGLKRHDGQPKLLFRLLEEGGVEAARASAWMGSARRTGARRHVLITGGAGFVGTNLADRLLSEGTPVLVLDNLSRPGVERNLRWLRERHEDLLQIEIADLRDRQAVRRAVDGASAVFHFAAQVAVTTSLLQPIEDFLINGQGTLHVLESVRAQRDPPPVIFTSTNKVYGALEDVSMRQRGERYEPTELDIRLHGIGEARPLAFHSPYGCSKGAADQYVLDYAHTFSLPATVFRMSCIYGPHQFGTEDQGWVAHFLIQAMQGRPITLYGDGMQVRDVLFVEDLVEAFLLALSRNGRVAGQAFNIGGGPGNTTSLLELIALIGELVGSRPPIGFDDWRPADQRYYVSDFRKFTDATGWRPTVSVRDGVQRLYAWLLGSRPKAPPRLIAGEATP